MATEDSVAQDQIKVFVERILRLKGEVREINADVREIYAEAKGNGFDKTVLGKLVNYVEKRQSDASALAEADAIFELYLTAYDGAARMTGTVRATHRHASEEADEQSAQVDEQKARLAALRADPAMSIVSAGDIKKSPSQPGDQAGQTVSAPATALTSPVESEPAAISTPVNEAQAQQSAVDADLEEQEKSIVPTVVKASTARTSKYAERGVITWESAPPEGVIRHDYSAAFGEYGQDIAVIEEDLTNAAAQPVVKNGCVILDGWARYMKARNLGIEYPVVQYDGTDSLLDVIRWNTEGRLMTSEQKFRVAQKLSREEPKRKADIYAAFELGMDLA